MLTTAVSLDSASSASLAKPEVARSVALQDELARCTRQLGDWVACPSSKTPEGKKIIENLRTQIGNIESQLGTRSSPVSLPAASPTSRAPLSTLGSLVNAFA